VWQARSLGGMLGRAPKYSHFSDGVRILESFHKGTSHKATEYKLCFVEGCVFQTLYHGTELLLTHYDAVIEFFSLECALRLSCGRLFLCPQDKCTAHSKKNSITAPYSGRQEETHIKTKN
jgi:hypothetical protein